jgi:tetratricopeptide (TPR) repeat protein
MKSAMQILFILLVAGAYFAGVRLVWLGVFPTDSFADLMGQSAVVTPLVVLLAPLTAFVVFLLGYDPRDGWLGRARSAFVAVLSTARRAAVACGVVFIALAASLVASGWLLARPTHPGLQQLLNDDFDNAAESAKNEIETNATAAIIHLVSDAEVEAKRRSSASNDQTEQSVLLRDLPEFDAAWKPVWHRYLASHGLARLAFARRDRAELDHRFDRARQLALWLGADLVSRTTRAHAESLFELSLDADDEAARDTLEDRAEEMLRGDDAIASQRALAKVYYSRGCYGDAIRVWSALLHRDVDAQRRGLDVPGPSERKKLRNNIALALLQQAQPEAGLHSVAQGLAEPWNTRDESDRTDQVRLLATRILCLLAAERPDEALATYTERAKLITQGQTIGSLLILAMIESQRWALMDVASPASERSARKVLQCLIDARGFGANAVPFVDHTRESYEGLVEVAASHWRYPGIQFDTERVLAAILSLVE